MADSGQRAELRLPLTDVSEIRPGLLTAVLDLRRHHYGKPSMGFPPDCLFSGFRFLERLLAQLSCSIAILVRNAG